MKLFDSTFSLLEKAMDVRFRRHEVLTSNLANAETPGFRARELDFAGELKKAAGTESKELKKTHSNHLDVGGTRMSHVIFDDTGAVRSDGNNVDLDLQMGKVSTNGRAYNAATTYMTMKLRLLRFAARGGRGGI